MWPAVHSPTLQNHVKSSWPLLEGWRGRHSAQVPKVLIRPQSLGLPARLSSVVSTVNTHSLPLLREQTQGLRIKSAVPVLRSFRINLNHHEGNENTNNLYCSPIQIFMKYWSNPKKCKSECWKSTNTHHPMKRTDNCAHRWGALCVPTWSNLTRINQHSA